MPVLTLGEDSYDADPDRPAWKPIPVDEFVDLRIVGIEQKVLPWQDDEGKDIHRVEFAFVIEGPEPWKDRKIWGDTPTTFTANEKCKLRNWVQEILGQELPAGFQLNTDDLIDMNVRGVVDQRKKKDGTIRNFIRDVLRTKASMVGVQEEVF